MYVYMYDRTVQTPPWLCQRAVLAFGSQQLMIVVLVHIAHSIVTGSVVYFRNQMRKPT